MEGLAGSTFAGRYRLIRRLGIGGMAEVYLARQVGVARFEKIVAIKTVLPQILESEAAVAMFIDEARIAAQLDHSNIVAVYDFGRTLEGAFYIVMEYVHGFSLSTMIRAMKRQGMLTPLPVALHVMAAVCRGLDYAHRKRDLEGRPLDIVHRDLDPQNILMSFEGDVKIGDFGIARASAAVRMHRSEDGVIKGKANYMAPEIVRGAPVDQRADLFTLGAVFYEMLAGARPFEAEDAVAVMRRVAEGVYEPLAQLNPECPEAVAALVDRALSRRPDDRFPSAEVMLAAIEGFCAEFAPGDGRSLLRRHLATYFPDHAANDNPTVDTGKVEAVTPSNMHRTTKWPPPLEPSAPAGNTTPMPRISPHRVGVVVAVLLLVALIPLTLWPRSRQDAPASATVTAAPTPSAAATPEAPASIEVPPPSATPAIATVPNLPAPASTTPQPAVAPAYLSVGSDVGCRVSVGSKLLGETPLASAPVAAGPHEVRCEATSLGLSTKTHISPVPGESVSVNFRFLATLNVNAVPWADVYLDGKLIGQTPLVKTDMIPGSHVVRLVNDSLGKSATHSREFASGDQKVITEDFTAEDPE